MRAEEFGAGRNDAQDIVEVVSDASREPSHRFHFLALAKLFLGFLLGGYVTGDGGGSDDFAARVANRRDGDRYI